jgi:ABC-type branched-subunit amino acid transport system substrate-binding protein
MPRLQPQAFALLFAVALVEASCSATFTPKTCNSDSDCGSGLACAPQSGNTNACVAASNSAATLTIGMSAPGSGPNEALGLEMRRGVQLAFSQQNAAGGVNGRQLALSFLDDQYTPSIAAMNVASLLDVQTETGTAPVCPSTTASIGGNPPVASSALARGSGAVLALLGDVGTPTMEVTAPVAIETGTLFFGAFTGATTLLRDTEAGPCAKYIFNVRASYADETRATTEYFLYEQVPDYTHFLSFDQDDAYGQAGYSGLTAAYVAEKGAFPATADATNPIARFRYTRNDVTSVPAQATAAEAYILNILQGDTANHVFGVEMTDTYGEGVEFIQLLRDWQYGTDPAAVAAKTASRLSFFFSNISFSGPDELAAGLVMLGTYNTPNGAQPYTTDVSVSQVVPNYQSDTSDLVTDYKKQLALYDPMIAPTFTSLEGYAAAQVFVAGLLQNTGAFTSDNLIATFESLKPPVDTLGGGSFSPTSHNYSKSVYGTGITAQGGFSNLYSWVEGSTIQTFD